jgi:hypothetical protein
MKSTPVPWSRCKSICISIYYLFTIYEKLFDFIKSNTDDVSFPNNRHCLLFNPVFPKLVYSEAPVMWIRAFEVTNINQYSIRTSQETHYVSATEPKRLMSFRKKNAVYCENHMKHMNTLCGQNAEFRCVKGGGTNRALKGQNWLKMRFNNLQFNY